MKTPGTQGGIFLGLPLRIWSQNSARSSMNIDKRKVTERFRYHHSNNGWANMTKQRVSFLAWSFIIQIGSC